MNAFYESDRAVREYLLFHYGAADEILPWPTGPRDALDFPTRCVRECLLTERLHEHSRALDLGCAVGRATFELARHCREARGIDTSAAFIAAARELQANGEIAFPICVEGTRTLRSTARIPPGIDRSRVHFEVGDALALTPTNGLFDVVFAANLLDRVPKPRRLIETLATLVSPGGQLVVISPYTWLAEYTAPEEWLCQAGRSTADVLAELLPGFARQRRLDLPFLIREHARRYQWSVAEATVWTRAF